MADIVGKCNILLENAFNINGIKEEDSEENDFMDDKIQISETAITTDNIALKGNLICDEMKELTLSTTLDTIKTEPSLLDVQNDMELKLKTEDGFTADDLKIEFHNGLLYCEDCHVYYEDYCAECGMLVHILNKNTANDTINGERVELPDDILEIQDYFGEPHIFAVQVIPVGVKFGPFTGLNRTEHPWKIKGGKFVVNRDKSKYLNWMQCINPARNISEQNLLVFQHERNLYYQTTRQIQEGDELLVYFGEQYEDSVNRNVEMDFVPTTEHIFKDTFACTFCCLGFSSNLYLTKHKTICPENATGETPIEELTQCPTCKIYIDQKEYIKHHMAYCCERNGRKSILPTTTGGKTQVNERKTRRRLIYKRKQSKYTTKDKGDLKNRTNLHHEVKMFKCELCCRRFKTNTVLRWHVENTHIRADGKGDFKYSAGTYTKAPTTAAHSYSQDQRKPFKCSLCEFRTKYKLNLRRHLAAKHSEVFKCATCDYKSNWKHNLQRHIERRHSKGFKYKCDMCDFKTDRENNLRVHMATTHLKLFKFNCETCDYKANQKNQLKVHIKTTHLNEFKYKCDTCEYKTNLKCNLKRHIDSSRHLNEFKYKYDTGAYKTNRKHRLKRHIEARFLGDFKYKCDLCDYKANQTAEIKSHIETRHLKEFKYKCDRCDYKSNRNDQLKVHIESRHLNEFKYKCDSCQYKTNRNYHLKSHIEARHMSEFKYKCDTCEYKTNFECNFKIHIETRHLREFKYKCDICYYETNLKHNLKTHTKARHLKVLNYKCDTCNYKSSRKYDLKRHIVRKH